MSGETPENPQTDGTGVADVAPARDLSDAAKRALAEAEERRRAREAAAGPAPREVGGRSGPDPARYGDWEKDGIISDF